MLLLLRPDRPHPLRVVVRHIGSNTEILEQKSIEAELRMANQDQFASSASHDLQEPVRAVSVYRELLGKRYGHRLDGEAVDFLRYLVDSSRRVQLLLRDLLTYTQLSKVDAPAGTVNANQVLKDVRVDLTEAMAESADPCTSDPYRVCISCRPPETVITESDR